MTKYKAVDKVTILLNKHDSTIFNTVGDMYNIISHEPAPEPIKKRFIVCKDGFVDLAVATDYRWADYIGDFEVTITGNDFTVEKVTG